MDCWLGKHVLVTGASRGLGLEFARGLAGRGADVLATCRTPSRATALRSLASTCDRVRIEALDTTRPETAHALARQVETLDVLINNAGIATSNHPFDPVLQNDPDELMAVLGTNVVGTIATTNAFLPCLRRGGSKTIAMLSPDLGSNDGSTVVALSPGWAATELGSRRDRTPPLTACGPRHRRCRPHGASRVGGRPRRGERFALAMARSGGCPGPRKEAAPWCST